MVFTELDKIARADLESQILQHYGKTLSQLKVHIKHSFHFDNTSSNDARIEVVLTHDGPTYKAIFLDLKSPSDFNAGESYIYPLGDPKAIFSAISTTINTQITKTTEGKPITVLDHYCKKDNANDGFSRMAYLRETLPRYLRGTAVFLLLDGVATVYLTHAILALMSLTAPYFALLNIVPLLNLATGISAYLLAGFELRSCIAQTHGNGIIAATGSQAKKSYPTTFFLRVAQNTDNAKIGSDSIKRNAASAGRSMKQGFFAVGRGLRSCAEALQLVSSPKSPKTI